MVAAVAAVVVAVVRNIVAQDIALITASVVPKLIAIILMAVMVMRRVAMQAVHMWVTAVVSLNVGDLVKDSVDRRAQHRICVINLCKICLG